MVGLKKYNTGCYFISEKELPQELLLDKESGISLVNHGSHCAATNFACSNGIVYSIEISTNSDEDAIKIADVLAACFSIIEAYCFVNPEYIINNIKRNQSNQLSKLGDMGAVFHGDNSPFFACQLLQQAYGNQRYINAIVKYHFAQTLYTLNPMDLEPHNDPFIDSYILTEQIKIAYVTIVCYSILEELNLEIIIKEDKKSVNKDNENVTEDNKSATKNNGATIDGDWNPEVKNELCARLEKNNIDLNSSIIWTTRGNSKRPFKKKAVKYDNRCDWSDGERVKDFNINICDAILELSHIRSCRASHGLGKKVKVFTVYDAENAFTLARYVLLQVLNINLPYRDNFV